MHRFPVLKYDPSAYFPPNVSARTVLYKQERVLLSRGPENILQQPPSSSDDVRVPEITVYGVHTRASSLSIDFGFFRQFYPFNLCTYMKKNDVCKKKKTTGRSRLLLTRSDLNLKFKKYIDNLPILFVGLQSFRKRLDILQF